MKLLNLTILCSCFMLLFFACNENTEPTTTIEETEQTSTRKVLKIGVVPQFSPKRIMTIWSPIIEELEEKTGYKFQIVGTPNIPEFEKEYQKGTYDIAYMNPYHSVVANQTQGYEAVLRDGTKSLFGVLAVKKDDLIKDIKELDGEKVSFPAPNALGASLLMRTELKTIHKIDIEPIYVKTHTNSYLSVLEGKTRAGGGVMRTYNELGDDIKNQLRIFYSTQKTPPHPIVIHPRVDKKTREVIVSALLEMGKDETLNAYLEKIPIKGIIETNQTEYKILEDLGMENFYVNPN
ncbi:MAG: phosphate/phosphite/phosphonate ABC transporter substrate-binding protein [Saprospiraceae bacterium]